MATLADRRQRAGLTQSELARRTGIAQPNIAAYETGRRKPTAATLARLEAALRPRPSELIAAKRTQVLEVLHRHGLGAPRVFGSVAAGTDQPDSDVDLVVEVGEKTDILDLIDAADELESLLGCQVDLVTSRSLRPDHEIHQTAVAL